jgi:hypothetical protein
MTTGMSQIDALQARLDAQQAELDELRRAASAEVETRGPASRSVALAPTPTVPVAAVASASAAPPSRRDLLRGAALTAAGGVALAAGAGVVTATPAAAINGSNLILGSSANNSTSYTKLTTTSPEAAIIASDGTSVTTGGAALAGLAGDNMATGVYGYSDYVPFNPIPQPMSMPSGNGVTGWAPQGYGVVARGRVNVKLFPEHLRPDTAQLSGYDLGSVRCDQDGELWFCVKGGYSHEWRKLSGPSTAGQLHVLPSTSRVYDSRAGQAPLNVTKGALANGAIRVIDLNITGALPYGTTAVMVNLAIVSNASTAGWLALWKNGVAFPGNASINWDHANQTISNMAVVAVDTSYKFQAKVMPGSSADFIVDLVGYYR